MQTASMMTGSTDRSPTLTLIRWLALCVLLHCRVSMMAADECGTRFTDPISSTVLAQVVLQGHVMGMNSDLSDARTRSANVSVDLVFKGNDILERAGLAQQRMVRVTRFGHEDKDSCIASMEAMQGDTPHIFFLRQTSHRDMLQLSALPIHAEEQNQRRVRRSLCDTCVRPPDIRRIRCINCAVPPKMKKMKSRSVKEGRRARLRCAATGKPAMTFSWMKDSAPVTSGSDGITIKSRATSSTIIFRSVTRDHGGLYRCVVSNQVGRDEKVVNLDVIPARSSQSGNAPSRACVTQTFCLNGGTCVHNATDDTETCRCPSGYRGIRCQKIAIVEAVSTSAAGAVQTDAPEPSRRNVSVSETTQAQQVAGNSQTALEKNANEEQIPSPASKNDQPASTGPLVNPSSKDMFTNTNIHGQDGGNITAREGSRKDLQPGSNRRHLHGTSHKTGTDSSELSSGQSMPSGRNKQSPKSPSATGDRPARNISSSMRKEQPVPDKQNVSGDGSSATQSTENLQGRNEELTSDSRATSARELKHLKARLKKGRLKVQTCREKHYCLNGGRCKYIPKKDIRYCECRKGFAGPRCEQLDDPASVSSTSSARKRKPVKAGLKKGSMKAQDCKEKHYCHNGGRCKYFASTDVRYCQCSKEFTGSRCEQLYYDKSSVSRASSARKRKLMKARLKEGH